MHNKNKNYYSLLLKNYEGMKEYVFLKPPVCLDE